MANVAHGRVANFLKAETGDFFGEIRDMRRTQHVGLRIAMARLARLYRACLRVTR